MLVYFEFYLIFFPHYSLAISVYFPNLLSFSPPQLPVSLFSLIRFPSHPLFLFRSSGITSFPDLSIRFSFPLNPTLSLSNSTCLLSCSISKLVLLLPPSRAPYLSLNRYFLFFSHLLFSVNLSLSLSLSILLLYHTVRSPLSRSSSSVRSLSPPRSLFSYPSCFASPSPILLHILSPLLWIILSLFVAFILTLCLPP